MARTDRDFRVVDLLRYRLVRDVQLHPDGSELVLEIKSIDADADTYRSHLELLPTGGGMPLRLTHDGWSTMARWSPDGRQLAFLSDRSGHGAQVHVLPRAGGEARRVTHLPHAVQAYAWAPDGRRFVVSSDVDTETRPPDTSADAWRRRPQVVERQRYKSDGSGFLLHKVAQLFVVDLDGTARQLTHAVADALGPAWAPDGRRIVFCQSRPGPRESHITDVVILDVDSGRVRIVCDEIPSASKPAWSPDGRWLAFSGTRNAGDAASRLWLLDLRTDRLVECGGADGYEIGSYPLTRSAPPQWAGDSRSVAILQAYEGLTRVAVVSVPDGRLLAAHGGDRQATCLHAVPSRLAYAAGSLAEPVGVFAHGWTARKAKPLVQPNADWWFRRALPRVARRRFRMPDGREIGGWLLRPARSGGPAPVLVDVHGGPMSYVEFEYPYHPNWYALIARGWCVLALDALGSSSYRREDAEALRGQWGEVDLPQHIAAVRALQREGVAGRSAVIAGKSYGGYLSAWAIGQTDFFRAAVVSAPVANLESHAGTSDSGYYVMPYDMKGELAEQRRRFHELSPVHHAHKATTPTLILQGAEDQRCPIGQAEELFSILMREGKAPVRMVVYPNGHHDLAEDGRPSHRVHYHREIVRWARRWARTGRRPAGAKAARE